MFATVDLARPWCAAIRDAAEATVDRVDWATALNQQCRAQALTNHRGLPLSFVEQSVLPKGTAYETFISQTGQVPTRNNLHDYFNALVWLSFPSIKRELNALQAAQIESCGIGQSRGKVRDAATIFDENCALLVVSDTEQGKALVEALREHHWQQALLDQRELFGPHADVWLFGHALMEKLVTPYKSITAHAWPMVMPQSFFTLRHDEKQQRLDAAVANEIQQQGMSTARFMPLPVLGVPDWWQQQDRVFYADTSVFRPKVPRRVASATTSKIS